MHINLMRRSSAIDWSRMAHSYLLSVRATMGGPLRVVWPALAIALVSLAGCGTSTTPNAPSSTTPSSSPQPSVSSSAPLGQAKQFSSPELGVSFRYPSDWQLTPPAPFDAQGNASVSAMDPDHSGGLTLLVSSPATAGGKSPGPFSNATRADLDMAVQSFAPEAKILDSTLAYLDDLRLAQVEYISGPSAVGNEPRSHAIYFASGFAAAGSQVTFAVDAVRSAWKKQEPTLRAILDSMRFSQPKGTP